LYRPLETGTAVHLHAGRSIFLFQLLFQTLDSSLGLSHFLGAVADAVALGQQAFQFGQFHVLKLSDAPVQRVAFGDQIGLKGAGIIAHNAPCLGQMDFKACAFGHAVLSGPAQTDDRIHDIFSGAGAALIAGFSGMMDKQDSHAPATQLQQPCLHGLP